MIDKPIAPTTAEVMRVGYDELIGSHMAACRRAKNRNAEIAIDRVLAALSHISTEALVAKGSTKSETEN